MAQRDLVAALRAYKAAEARYNDTRFSLDTEIHRAVKSGEWQIVDVAELTGWSRETVRKIVKDVDKRRAEQAAAQAAAGTSEI